MNGIIHDSAFRCFVSTERTLKRASSLSSIRIMEVIIGPKEEKNIKTRENYIANFRTSSASLGYALSDFRCFQINCIFF